MLKQKEAAAKRFRKPNQDESGQSSAYMQQKQELETMAGSKADEASKWLVR